MEGLEFNCSRKSRNEGLAGGLEEEDMVVEVRR